MIKPKVTVRRNPFQAEAIMAAVKRANGAHVTIGVHDDGRKYPGDKAPAPGRVAFWMEYGTEHVPARPFLAPAVDSNKGIIKKAMAESLVRMAYGNWTVAMGLSLIGQTAVILVQNKIKSNVGPSLSGQWDPPRGYLGEKKKKGQGQRTLIATGTLYDNVQFKMWNGDGTKLSDDAKQQGASPPDNGNPQTAREKRAAARAEAAAGKKRATEQRQAARSAEKAKATAERSKARAQAKQKKQVDKDFNKFFKTTHAGKQIAARKRAHNAEQRRIAKQEQAEE